jgi:hypothetical protein
MRELTDAGCWRSAVRRELGYLKVRGGHTFAFGEQIA